MNIIYCGNCFFVEIDSLDDAAPQSVVHLIICAVQRIMFTGVGSEANDLDIKSVAFANWN